MKKLTLLNDSTNIKLGDTGTLIQFKASINDEPVFLKEGQTATFRIKNSTGFLKSIESTTAMNGYVFQFDSSELVDLPVDSYQIELAITKSDDDVLIFPDKDFVEFNITENALSVTGDKLPIMSLDAFKNELNTYVKTKADELESNFADYVNSVKQGPQGIQGPQGVQGIQGEKGQDATVKIGEIKSAPDFKAVFTGTKDNLTSGYLDGSGEHESDADVHTPFINITGGFNYSIQFDGFPDNDGTCRVLFYDENKNNIYNIALGNQNVPYEICVPTPVGAKFMRISTYRADLEDYQMTVYAQGNTIVKNSGTDTNAVLNFNLLPGPVGAKGESATVKVGTVTTSGDNTGSVTNSGTENDVVLDFELPIDTTALDTANKASQVAYSVLDQSNKNAVSLMAMQSMLSTIQSAMNIQDLTDGNLNNAQITKVYCIKGIDVTNAPVPSVWGFLIVIAFPNKSNGLQILVDTNSNRLYFRNWSNYNSFKQWKSSYYYG